MNNDIETRERDDDYGRLIGSIGNLLSTARTQVANSANTILVQTYWHIGQYIVEYEQQGQAKAIYGEELINRLAADLRVRYGKGFSRSNLFSIRQFYLQYPKIQTLSGLLSWSHYIELFIASEEGNR